MSDRAEKIQFMVNCGVERSLADEALWHYRNDAERALNMIFSNVYKKGMGASSVPRDANVGGDRGAGAAPVQGPVRPPAGPASNQDANSNKDTPAGTAASEGTAGADGSGTAAGTTAGTATTAAGGAAGTAAAGSGGGNDNATGTGGNGMTRVRSHSQIEMDKAIAASLAEKKKQESPLLLQRPDPSLPLGLRNLGNTCFVNCLLQVYFHLPMFRQTLLSGVVEGVRERKRERKPGEPPTPTVTPVPGPGGADDQFDAAVDASAEEGGAADGAGADAGAEGDGDGGNGNGVEDEAKKYAGLVDDLRRLFAYLVMSDKKYCNPADVLQRMQQCRVIQSIGFQEDISEVNDLFLAALEKTPLKPFVVQTFQGKTVTNYRYNRSEDDTSMAGSINRPDSFSNMHATVLSEDTKTDFYEALDDETSTEMVSFTTDENFKTTAEKVTLIKRFPPCFTLQLRRIRFDQDSMQLRKINAPFWFEQEVYFGRYLWSHREEIMQRRRAIADQKATIAERKGQIASLSHGGKDGHTVVGETLALLERLGREEAAAPLREVHQRLKVRIEGLYAEASALEKNISLAFDDMMDDPYVLHAVVVHEGRTVDMGHYCVYILVGGKRWYKFNDTNVDPLEDDSFIQKVRDHPDKSVYLLFYVKKELSDREEEGEGEVGMLDMVPVALREEVQGDNAQFVVDVQEYLEAEERAITQERTTFKSDFAKRWEGMAAIEKKMTNPKTPIHSPLSDKRITSLAYFVWLLGEEDVARYQLALEVYKDVVKHPSVNPQADLLSLIEIEKPDAAKLEEVEGLRRLFMTVTHYFAKGVKFMSFYSAHDFQPMSPIEAFRVALAYDSLIPDQYPKIRRREEITKYFSVTLCVFLRHGNQMLRADNMKCTEFFQSLVDQIPILAPSDKFCLFVKYWLVAEFFDNMITVRTYGHRFKREEERALLNQWILHFQQLNHPEQAPRVFEKPSEITQTFGVQEFTGLTEGTLARELLEKKKRVNNTFWNTLNRYKNSGVRDKYGYPAKSKNYQQWSGYFKEKNLITATGRFF